MAGRFSVAREYDLCEMPYLQRICRPAPSRIGGRRRRDSAEGDSRPPLGPIATGIYSRRTVSMPLQWPPRGGGVALRLTEAGCTPRIWARARLSAPKAMAGPCGDIADASPHRIHVGATMGDIPRISHGGVSLELGKIYRPLGILLYRRILQKGASFFRFCRFCKRIGALRGSASVGPHNLLSLAKRVGKYSEK